MTEIELHPGRPFCTAETLNRIARQQGLCLAIAQAAVFDEICQAVHLPQGIERDLVDAFRRQEDLEADADLEQFLTAKGWQRDDLLYFASKAERLQRFQRLMFADEVELRFLSHKADLDQIHYSLIRLSDGDLAFELHQRLLENEDSFEELAARYSEGDERDSGGRIGPVSLSQAHPVLVEKLRISQPGQLWAPFFLVNIWVILRLDHWQGSRLDDSTRQILLEDLFSDWLQKRVEHLLRGEEPPPLPTHVLTKDLDQPRG